MGIEDKVVNNLRVLSCSMINKANSGHSGIVLGAMPTLYALYSKHIVASPTRANSIFRDRFVLSAGHGSAMLYSVLYAMGYPISKQDLMNFRKFKNPKVAGHPELNEKCGIDCSTGPLGQGVATAVGIAIGQKMLADRYNKKDDIVFDAKTYTLVGDGCLMEGVSAEAFALAGTLNLNNLIVLYDSNKVSLDSPINKTFNIDIKQIMKGYGFDVFEVENGNDLVEINQKINLAKKSNRPSFIIVNTNIGYKTSVENTNKAHGLVLKDAELQQLKFALNISTEDFELDKDVQLQLAIVRGRFNSIESEFDTRLKHLKIKYPREFAEIEAMQNYSKKDFRKPFLESVKGLSSREMGGYILNDLAKQDIRIIGGCADVSSSTKAYIKDGGEINKDDFSGRNIMFGIREFAMACVSNGLALMGFKPFASTFFAFSDYMRGAIRMSAMMKLPIVYIVTHDSIAVGEDGATHQPIEQLASFRSMPNLNVFRPATPEECFEAYNQAFNEKETPSLIVLTRQKINPIDYKLNSSVSKGAYIISEEEKGKLDGTIIATGSEMELAINAQKKLKDKGFNIRVVSMFNTNSFDKQSLTFKENLLGSKNVVAIEAGAEEGLAKYTYNLNGVIGISEFGESGTSEELFNKFNISTEEIINRMREIIKINKKR